MREIHGQARRAAIRVFADSLDRESERRLLRLAQLAHLAGPIVVLPDVHPAGESVVGTVLVSADAIYPSLIGDDIGCGMASIRLPLEASSFDRTDWERILARISDRVPAGRARRRSEALPEHLLARGLSTRALDHARERVGAWHFATLGEGNHFLEIQRDPEDRVWVTVHSGSRGIGSAIAAHHVQANGKRDHGLPVLPLGSEEAERFLRDQAWALDYSAASRQAMLEVARTCIHPGAAVEESLDVTHNGITREVHAGNLLVVHRKGATPAPAGGRGIVPGSMATASYIVEGLGAPESYASCSHGAGRRLTRSEARRRISPADLRRRMANVVFLPGNEETLVEEAPQAYKDVGEVLRQQEALVRPLLRLSPLAVLKG